MKKNPARRRTFQAPIALSGEARDQILFLSRCMIQLWNIAQEECEKRLAAGSYLKRITARLKEGKEKLALPDGTSVLAHKLFSSAVKPVPVGISSISLNYWLLQVRPEGKVTLEDGTEIRLNEISNDLEREVLRKLAGSYSSFFKLKKEKDTRAKKPGQKKEDWFQAMSWSQFSIKDEALRVPGFDRKRIAISLRVVTKGHSSEGDYLLEAIAGKEVKFVTLKRDRYTGQFLLSLTVSEPPAKPATKGLFRAIDLGARDIAVTDSDGSEYLISSRRSDPFWMGRNRNDHIAEVEAAMEKKAKGSRRWNRLLLARREMHRKQGEQKNDFQLKVAKALTSGEIQCIIVGKGRTRLGLARSEAGSAAQHYGAQNTGYLFRQFLYLKNKAEERGIRFIEVKDPRRRGDLSDPESKFLASRALLREGIEKAGKAASFPKKFERKEFKLDQGKGAGHPHHIPGRQNTPEYLAKARAARKARESAS